MSMKKKCIVLGAGVAGLCAGVRLSSQGYTVYVVEKQETVGGLCRTLKANDFLFDIGGHRFITDQMELLDEVKDLLQDDLLTVNRKSVINFLGKEFNYPLTVKDFFSLNFSLKIKSIFDFIVVKLFHAKSDETTLEKWLIKRFGKTLYNLFFKEYSAKLWGKDPKEISSDWAYQRISSVDLLDVFLRLFKLKRDFVKTYADTFYYPKYGIAQIADKLTEKIIENKGQVYCCTEVSDIKIDNDLISEVTLINKKGDKLHIDGDLMVLSTIPLNDLVLNVCDSSKVKQVAHIAQNLHFRSLITVNLGIDKESITDNSWMYISSAEYVFFRIQEPKNWSPYLVPAGKTSLTLEIACWKGDTLWSASDKDLIDRTVDDLAKLGYDVADHIIGSFVHREEHAYPVYSLDYKDNVDTLLGALSSIKNLKTFGRQGVFRYNNMDHSMKMGFDAAEQVS